MSPADNMPRGGDAQAAALARLFGYRPEELGKPKSHFVTLGRREAVCRNPPSTADFVAPETDKGGPGDLEVDPDGSGGSRTDTVPDGPVANLVEKSLQESIRETGEWMIKTGLEIGAHCICPALGHLVTIAFQVKEVFDDATALDSADSPRELHIPLGHLAPGIEFEASMQLGSGGEKDGPRLSVLVAPGDGGLFGGWALERDKDHKAAGQTAPTTDQDAPEGTAVVHADLWRAAVASADLRVRASILRGSASRLLSQLWAMPEYSGTSLTVIYDDQTDLGMWLVRREKAASVSAWGIRLESDAETGLLIARLRA